MISIQLTQGKVAVVDDVDADLAAFTWCAHKQKKTFYAVRGTRNRREGTQQTIRLHNVIAARMGIKGQADHADRNGLNNTRENLRASTNQQNGANHGLNKNSTSGVKGVSWHKARAKWRASIMVDGRSRHLGLFADMAAAEAAVKAAREKAFGEYACHG